MKGPANSQALIRFILVGTAAAIVHYAAVFIQVEYLGLQPLRANIWAFCLAFWVSYAGHSYWSFEGYIPFVPEGTGFAIEDCGMQCKAQNVDGSLTPSRLCNAAMRPQDRSQDSTFGYEGYITNRLIHRPNHRHSLPRFAVLAASGFALNQTAYALVLKYSGLGYQLALLLVLLGVALGTFVLSRTWAFASHRMK